MKALVGIQARSNSKRLPGKIYESIDSKPMLLRIVDEMKKCKALGRAAQITVAVLGPQEDVTLTNFCKDKKIEFFGGHEDDLIDRYYYAAKHYEADTIIRVTGDCPMISHELVDEAIVQLTKVDYVTNCIIRTFAEGLDVQGCSRDALAWFYECQGDEREHPFVSFESNAFERQRFMHDGFTFRYILDKDSVIFTKLSVDTKEDLKRIRKYVASAKKQS